MTYETELYHYGIKGMHWGVRRYQNSDGSLTDAGRRRQNRKDRKAIKKDRKEALKNRSLLSDEELDQRVRRLEKEKRLRDLTNQEVKAGRSEAKKNLDKYGNQITSSLVNAGATALGAAAISGIKYLYNNPDPIVRM